MIPNAHVFMEMGTSVVLKAQVWERRLGVVLFTWSAQPLENDNDEMFNIRQFNEEKREAIQRMVALNLICFIFGPKLPSRTCTLP